MTARALLRSGSCPYCLVPHRWTAWRWRVHIRRCARYLENLEPGRDYYFVRIRADRGQNSPEGEGR